MLSSGQRQTDMLKFDHECLCVRLTIREYRIIFKYLCLINMKFIIIVFAVTNIIGNIKNGGISWLIEISAVQRIFASRAVDIFPRGDDHGLETILGSGALGNITLRTVGYRRLCNNLATSTKLC